jgi:predicted HTH domain antitoxin
MKFRIQSSYDQQLNDLIKAFNSGLISFDEMCELNQYTIDKVNIGIISKK